MILARAAMAALPLVFAGTGASWARGDDDAGRRASVPMPAALSAPGVAAPTPGARPLDGFVDEGAPPMELTLAPPPRRRPPPPGDAGESTAAGSTTQPSGGAAAAPIVVREEEVPSPRLASRPSIPRPLGYAGGGDRADLGRIGMNGNFLPVPDRWRIGLPDAYVQNVRGNVLNPYEQNVLKGDYPVFGTQDIFFVLGLTSDTLFEARQLPVPSGVSSVRSGSFQFFGDGHQQVVNENFILSAELFKGDSAYQPKDWVIKATAVFNGNYVHANEAGVLYPDPSKRHDRTDDYFALQELFVEKRLADLSSNYDFVSIRAGIQSFSSDFRGFLFADSEPGVRLFGNLDNNRWQYNIALFNQVEKDTNSGLNTLNPRDQQIFIANLYRQDLFFPGYTGQISFATNWDNSNTEYDTNGFLVRPSPTGFVRNKNVQAYYIGWAGDGHIGRLNVTHQFYQALGNESFNEIAGKQVNINAQFAALALTYDQDYIRYRASFMYASGDNKPTDGHANGFDSIFDNPNFAGGADSFYQRQAVPLTGAGVFLTQRFSFLNDLRTSKEQGQANFVNPGLLLYNVGLDYDITPKLTMVTNASYLQFVNTSSMQFLLQDNKIGRDIGIDLSIGFEYRPLLNNNVILTAGAAALIPSGGFKDLYTSQTLYSTFFGVTLTY